MKQQDLKALTKVAVDRAIACREAAGAQLTTEQIEQVSGGALVKDASWLGIFEKMQAVDIASQVKLGLVNRGSIAEVSNGF